MKPSVVLFDFDGTLADTAPDLAAAANALRTAQGLAPLPLAVLRPMASQGARGLLGTALGLHPEDAAFAPARDAFLDHYARHMTLHTALFEGVDALLNGLGAQGIRWGIVTNKITRLAAPLVAYLKLNHTCAVLVCGDTTAHAKPHPAPLHYAAEQLGVAPQHCWYVGDDLRDIQAGQAAGMATVAAAYGYCGTDAAVSTWSADFEIDSPLELLTLLRDREIKEPTRQELV